MTSMSERLQNATEAYKREENEEKREPPGHTSSYQAPGRLGDPSMELYQDPRTNPQLLQTLAAMGADRKTPQPSLEYLSGNSSIDEIAKAMEEAHNSFMALSENLPIDIPDDSSEPEVERQDHKIKGGDGQDMMVYTFRTKGVTGTLPCVAYIHGGGMTIIDTLIPIIVRWCKSIANAGVVVALVDFRNAWTKESYNHFPAGLNDCCAAAKWLDANRDSLNITKIVLQGESGGGNLSLATALKAKREGWVDKIDGVYGVVPYISGAYGWSEEQKLRALPSLVECHTYFSNVHSTAFMAHFYAPKEEDRRNPLAWPYFATKEDMEGLPPHVLAMDELDPLRDEGMSYARRLLQAGVPAVGKVNLGVTHAAALVFRKALPELYKAAVRDIAAFAKSL